MSQAQEQSGERCGACRFYLANKDSNPKDPTGLCRRLPPQIMGDGDDFLRPIVSDLDWCGEFKPAR
jgi:hypothetical protein